MKTFLINIAMISRGRLRLCSSIFNSQLVCSKRTLQWRRKSYASSNAEADPTSAEPPNARKVRGKMLPKAQRQALVKSYVHKYRATNNGKFPSVTDAQKEVGGSYYVLRSILQELEAKVKTSTSEFDSEDSLGQGISKENEECIVVKESLISKMPVGARIQTSSQIVASIDVDTADNIEDRLEADMDSQTVKSAEMACSKDVTTLDSYSDFVVAESDLLKQDAEEISHAFPKKVVHVKKAEGKSSKYVLKQKHLLPEKFEDVSLPCHLKSESGKSESLGLGDHPDIFAKETDLVKDTKGASNLGLDSGKVNKKGKAASDYLTDNAFSKPKKEQYKESHEHDNAAEDISPEQTNDSKIPKKSTLWGNLKSFADDIINLWRKS